MRKQIAINRNAKKMERKKRKASNSQKKVKWIAPSLMNGILSAKITARNKTNTAADQTFDSHRQACERWKRYRPIIFGNCVWNVDVEGKPNWRIVFILIRIQAFKRLVEYRRRAEHDEQPFCRSFLSDVYKVRWNSLT